MPSRTSCSSASSVPVLLLGRGDDALELAGALDQRRPLLGARALDRRGDALGLRARLVAALDRRVAPGQQLLQRRTRPGRSPGARACGRRRWRDRAGRGGRASSEGIGAGGRSPVSRRTPRSGGGGAARDRRRMCGSSIERGRRVRLPHPPSRPTRPARPTSRCSATPSATTLDRIAAAQPDARRWSTCRPAAAGPTPSCATTSTTVALGLLAAGHRQGRPGRHLGAERRRVDARSSTPPRRSARSSSTSTRPTARTSSSYVLNQSGISLLVAAPAFKTSDYAAMIDRGPRRTARTLREVVLLGTPDWDALVARRARGDPARARPPAGRVCARRPDQHPVHVGHHRLPQGRHAVAPQHPQQRLLRRPAVRLHRRRPGLHPGALLPLLRHGDGQPRLPSTNGATMVIPAPGFDPAATLQAVAARALHVAVRGADDVHRRAQRPRLRRPTTCPRCAPGSWPARRARSR